MNQVQNFTKGFFKENPIFVLLLGMCPTLGVTGTAINGLGMGLATTFVLLMSNIVVASVKNVIPDKVRIPSYIVIIASFVTIVDLVMAGFTPALHEQLGIFIPLIVVNCLVLGRAEAFASRNNISSSVVDAMGMGFGFAMALTMLGAVREILGNGSIFNWNYLQAIRNVLQNGFGVEFQSDPSTILLFVMPPGAFIALGYLIAIVNRLRKVS